MGRNLRQALLDLERAGMLKRIHEEVDPYLEMAEIARQASDNGGPALLFEKVKGCRFQAAANIFGTRERMQFLFCDTLESTKTAIDFKANPARFFAHITPAKLLRAAKAGLHSLPMRYGSIHDFEECTLADLPQIVSWPEDGGAFITLPLVATRPCEKGGILKTNLGMYRIQISGNDYAPDECGLHYQINRDIAAHHQKAIEEGRPLKVSIFIGGPLAHTIAAVTPMPENLSELTLAGMLAGKRFRYFEHDGYLVSSDAEFCILGEMAPQLKPEGPFGDHVGYYSGRHDFPYLKVKKVLCKKNAIYPFTVVGRPPKEDSRFGEFIHEITRPMVPTSLPGVHAVHAVDEAGVHPLCLAIGSERFRPFDSEREPMELLKTANALLGFNQVSLSKYLLLAAKEDNPSLDINDVPAFFAHILERINFARDLHLQTSTTTDTLDYTGTSLNHGSKLVMVAAGKKCRDLRNSDSDLASLELPAPFSHAKIAMPGVITIQWDGGSAHTPSDLAPLQAALARWEFRKSYPWVSVIDQTETICAGDKQGLADFLWMTFTRSDPAQDLYGINERFVHKHWAIDAPLIVDARIKKHHQKPLTIDSGIVQAAKKVLSHLCLAGALLLAPFANAQDSHCGTSHVLQNIRKTSFSRFAAMQTSRNCDESDFFDSVYTRKTAHFEIFYTLDGIHATTEAFVDSVATNLEKAWNFHVSKMGMRAPASDSISLHYQKPIDKGFYGVEILDLQKIRHASYFLGSSGCSAGCFGLTLPPINGDAHLTQVFFDNDFMFSPNSARLDSIQVGNKTCTYKVSSSPIASGSISTDYAHEWGKGIRVTAFHELYHAVQLRYIDFNTFSSFWLEASASGVEEITAPDINDYISHVYPLLNNNGTPLDKTLDDYGAGIFYIYLYNHFRHDFDKLIWESFSKNPTKDFSVQLSKVLASKKMSADSVLQDFATRLAFSGSRSASVDTSFWIGEDQPLWPDIRYASAAGAKPSLRPFSYMFYSGLDLDLDNYVGKASVAQYKGDKVTIWPVINTATLDSIRAKAIQNDSLIWILSRFGESGYIPEVVKDSTLRAFPIPWRCGNLCFTPLLLNKKFIEIRNARGDLVMREKYTHTTHCIDEATVMDKMKPGVYRFRAGASGKTEKFLIVY